MNTSTYGRRSAAVGNPTLVRLPTSGDWQDSHEGGLAFWFVIEHGEQDRQICIAGNPIQWNGNQDVIVTEDLSWRDTFSVDAGLLIGSTGQSLWSAEEGRYWQPTTDDLTEEGRALYGLLERLYGVGTVQIVTLLDT